MSILGAGVLTARAVPGSNPNIPSTPIAPVPLPYAQGAGPTAPLNPHALNPYAPSAHLAAYSGDLQQLRYRGLWQAFAFFLLPVSLGAVSVGINIHTAAAIVGGVVYPGGLFLLRSKTGLSWKWIGGLLLLLPIVFALEAWLWIAVVFDL